MLIRGWQADEGACGFYRIAEPFAALNSLADVEAQARLYWSGPELVEADVSVVQRAADAHIVLFLEEVQRQGGRVIYELDDDLLHLDPKNPLFRHYQVRSRRMAVAAAIALADAVVVSTEPLAAAVAPINPRVSVLENRLPQYWQNLSVTAGKLGRRTDAVRVVWAGSVTHGQDFHDNPARYGVTRLAREAGIEFHMVGYDYGPKLGVSTTFHPWRASIPAFHQFLATELQPEIGLCPLARTKFNEAKSGLKAMEYQAAGIVPVATRCTSYAGTIEHGVTGFLCSTQMEWKDALYTLATDHELRAEMRRNCLALTEGRLYSAHASEWLATYASVLDV